MAEIILALDVPAVRDARALVDRLGREGRHYKVGLELFTRAGPDFVRELKRGGSRVFLDLKLHDIPNTVAGAVRAAAELDVDLLTVHAVGGPAMTGAAVRAVDEVGARTRVLAVTVLTSLGVRDLSVVRGRTGVETKDEVERLGQLAARAGAHGAVCSPWEVEALRAGAPPDFLFVTPGIRPAGTDVDDQRRVATPAEAVSAGATHLVVGRAVTRARDPLAALAAVEAEISSSPRHSD